LIWQGKEILETSSRKTLRGECQNGEWKAPFFGGWGKGFFLA